MWGRGPFVPLAACGREGQTRAPMSRRIEVTAPGRANLIGNPSDQYGGCTLACSVPLRARVILDASQPGRIAAAGESIQIASPADLESRDDALEIGRAVLRAAGLANAPFGIEYETEIPRQSGMAGSTALLVALQHAVDCWFGTPRSPSLLAEAARDLEARGMGIQCGFVDHYACTYGGLLHVDFRGKSFEAADAGPLATVEDLGGAVDELPFWLAYTGVRHSSDGVHRPIRARWLAGEPAVVAGYERVAELGLLGKSALQRADWDTFGAAMNENHAIQRDLGGSGESNERLIGAARGAGALGAKLAGAGDGGTIVALWTDPNSATLEAALRDAGAAALYRPVPVRGVRLESDVS